MDYKFRLEIGDWSNDGHGMHEDYIVKSNVPVQKVREAYWESCRLSGIKFEDYICSEYLDCKITYDQISTLQEIGISISNYLDDFDFECDNELYIDIDMYIDLLFDFIRLYNKHIILELVIDEMPTFHFYGFDEKGRHISFFGYGLFSH